MVPVERRDGGLKYVATAEWAAPATPTFLRLSGTWMLKVEKRRLNGKWHHDRYWIAPDGVKYRSRAEVTGYLASAA